ncbi:MAG TPA: Spx/MgsR family RNA polymerase-binding regulatory protein [Phnomibacter sp.]|nr:Spx/MgsR family RNA polymerase-binding regulatory protein [Phnomibacter sp.]
MASKKMIEVYGIPNCNTVKKALDHLKGKKAAFNFHDFKKEGISADALKTWANALGWESLLNKKGTTWRGLTPEEQQTAAKQKGALELMQQRTSVIKRPVIEWPDGSMTVGYDEALFNARL